MDEYRPWRKDEWLFTCSAEGIACSKTKVKKLAAYRVIVYLLQGAGIETADRQDRDSNLDFRI